MTQPNPSTRQDHEDDLDRAISDLRGALHDDAPMERAAGLPDAGRESHSGVVMSILVDVQIVLGSTEVPVSDLLSLQKGTTLALNRRIGEPVDIVANGRRIARGEITVLESDPSRFGVRVTEVAAGPGSN